MKILRPPFPVFPEIMNHRIILRELRETDLQQLIEISFYNGVPAKDLIDAQIMNGRINLDYTNGESIHWVIASVSHGEVLGTCGFYRGFKNSYGEIGYVLKQAHQGKGYIAEALIMMLAFGWKELELKAITGITTPGNHASMEVLKKAGFKLVDSTGDELVFLIRRPS